MFNKFFVVIEGVDGSGKSSVTNFLAEKIGATVTKTPTGLWRKYRNLVENTHPTLRFIYYTLANYDAGMRIRRSLKKSHVICDRYAHSTKAHHIVYGCRIARLLPLWSIASRQPDLVYYLTAEKKEREKRISKREENNKKDLDSEALERVHEVFQNLPGIIKINTTHLSIAEVSSIILQDIRNKLSSE